MALDPIIGSALIGGGISLLQGAITGSRAKKLRGQYDQAESAIPEQDMGMISYLGDTRRRRRAFEAGTDPFTSYTQEQINSQGAQTQANAVRSGRNNVSDLLRVQAGTNNALAQSGALASRNAASLFAAEGDLVGTMANRLYNRQLSDANRLWSEYARAKEDSNRQIQAGLGMPLALLGSGAFGGAKTATQVPGSSANPSLGQILGIGSPVEVMGATDSLGNAPGQASWWNP